MYRNSLSKARYIENLVSLISARLTRQSYFNVPYTLRSTTSLCLEYIQEADAEDIQKFKMTEISSIHRTLMCLRRLISRSVQSTVQVTFNLYLHFLQTMSI